MSYPPERGQQRYCLHHFTGGACVMCHYNPWKGKNMKTVLDPKYPPDEESGDYDPEDDDGDYDA